MPITYNKLQVHIDLAALVSNWKTLNARSGNAMAVVKSDAYGHGLIETSRALAQAGCTTFAVGTVEEAAQLRKSGVVTNNHRVIALLGPIDTYEYAACAAHNIQPFIGNFAQLSALAEANNDTKKPLAFSLKFNTGMSRLGFTLEDMPALTKQLLAAPGIKPVMLSSHLATGDDPKGAAYVNTQTEKFSAIRTALAEAGFTLEANLANSGGILAHPEVHFDSQRAGIAMYGMNPFVGTPWENKGTGLLQAMQVSAPIMEVHTLRAGESVSYGRTFTAPKNMRIAIVGAGYADGYSRSLTNAGGMCVHGVRVPIVGRVCMQMSAVDLTPLDEAGGKEAQVGDRVWLLGGEDDGYVTADELAAWWKTITYEVFCILGLSRKQFT